MVGCSVGLGGSGEGDVPKSRASLLEGCANCRLINSEIHQ